MSTLGGTRGERNAKPKFAALDINKLYITSRGESLEPSSQKSAVPRKHGMQSLGKVPTARRPPANLPSLKAEVGNPGEQSGSWTSDHSEGQNLIKSSSDSTEKITASPNPSISNSNIQQPSSLNNSKHCESSWNTNEFPSLDGTGPYGGNINNKSQLFQDHYPGASQSISRHQNDTVCRIIQQKGSGGRAALSNIATEDIDGGGGNNLGGSNNCQGTTASSQSPPLPPQFRALLPPFMQRGSDSGLTGNENEGGTSSLPALSTVSPLPTSGMGNDSKNNNIVPNANNNSNNLDNSKMSITTSTSSKKNNNNENTGNSSNSFGTVNVVTNATKISNQFPQKQPSGLTMHSQQQQNARGGNNFSSMSTAKGGRVVRGVSGASSNTGREASSERSSGTAYNDNYQHGNRRGINHQPRYANRNTTGGNVGNYNSSVGHARSGGSGNIVVSGDAGSPSGFHDDNRNSHPPYGSAVVAEQEVVVRPIIRDEELQRLEAIAKDEGWAKDYEFDYNQKLEFSDDESEITSSSTVVKEKDTTIGTVAKMVMVVNEEKATDLDKFDKHHRTQDNVGVAHRDRDLSLVQEGNSMQANVNNGMRGIGGGEGGGVINVNIVAGGLDAAEAKERIKQRREEDQRREIERKQAAARKLQELEEKLSRKKNDESLDGRPGNNDKATSGGVNLSLSSTGNVVTALPGSRMEEEKSVESVVEHSSERIISVKIRGKSGERANVKEIRYEFGAGGGARYDREGGNLSGGSSANWDMPGFSKTFQSNLPPRFQKRKLERNTSGTNLSTTSNNNTTSSQTSSRNTNNYSPGSNGPPVPNSGSETKSTIPFAQQYDPRFIHNQQTYGRSVVVNAMSSSRRSGTTTASAPVRDREERQRQQYEMREHNQREATKEKLDSGEDNNRFNVAFGGSPESSANNHAKSSTGGRITPQLVRSLSESSNRKTSVSSDENHHNIGHHALHTSSSTHNSGSIVTMSGNYGREISWDTEVEKGSSASSPASFSGSERPLRSDCEQPKQILHRVKEVSSEISDAMKEEKMSNKRIMKNVDCESNQKNEGIERSEHSLSDSVVTLQESHTNNSNVAMDPDGNKVDAAGEKTSKVLQSEESSTFGVVEANMKENIESCLNECAKDAAHLDSHQSRALSGTDDKTLIASTATAGASSQQHGGKKKGMTLIHQQHSRDNRRHDTRGGSRGGSYSGGFHRADVTGGSSVRGGTSNWNRSRGGSRGGGGSRGYNQDYWSESEFSEEGFDEQSKHHLHQKIYNNSIIGSAGVQNVDAAGATLKEGFVPRGEPSRRGRGGGNVGSSVAGASSSNTNNRQKQQHAPFSGCVSSMDGTGSISKKMEGYGPPSSKSPFGGGIANSDDRNTKHRVGDSMNSNTSAASPTRDDRAVQKSARPIPFTDASKATDDVSSIDQEKICAIIGEGKPGAIEVRNDESHSREDNLISQKSGARSSITDNRVAMEISDACDTIKSGTMVDDTKTKTKSIIIPITTKSGSSTVSQQQSKNATTLPGTINSGNNSSLDGSFALQGNATVANIGNIKGGSINHLGSRKQQSVSRGQGAKASNTDTITDISSGPGSNTNQTVPTLMNINNSGNKAPATLVTRSSTISVEGERACHMQQQQQQSAIDKLSAPSPVNNAKTDNDKHNLDGSNPPVNTIIFENTNYKSGVSVAVLSGSSTSPVVGDCGVGGDATVTGLRRQHSGNSVTNFGTKVNTGLMNDKMTTGAAGVVGGLINSQQSMTSSSSAHRPITTTTVTTANEGGLQHNIVGSSPRTVLATGVSKQQPCNIITSSLQGIPFQKSENDYKDIKSYAFETDISHLIDGDKGIKQQSSVSAGLCLSKSIEAEGAGSNHAGVPVSVKNMISPSTADLNMKIASVKKVWEMPTVPEQTGTVVNTGSGSSANRVNAGNEHSVSGGGNVASGSNVHLKSNFVRGPHHPSHQAQYQHPHPGTGHHTHQTHGTHSSYGAAFGSDSDSLVDHFNNSNSVCNVSGSAGSNSGCDINSTITLNTECNDSSNGGYSLSHHHSQQQPAKPHQQTHQQQQLQQQHHQQELQHQRQPHNMQESSSQQSSQQHTQQPQKQLQQHQSQHALQQQHTQQLQRQQQQHKDQPQHLQQLQQLHQQSQPQHKPQTQSQSQPQQSQALAQSQTQASSQSQPQSQTQTSQSQSQLQTQTQSQMKTQQQQQQSLQQQTQQLSQQLPQLSQSQTQQHPHQHQQQHPSHKQSQLQQQLQQHPVQHPQQLQQSHHQQSLQLQHQQQTQQQSQHVTSVGVQQHQAAVAVSLGLNKHPVADVLAAAVAANNVNVCKVKPTQQNNGGGMHQSSSMGLSPPPQMQSGSIPSAPQPFFPAQYGVSAIPSPPAVLYNSPAVAAAAMNSQGGLYNAFQIEPSGRSQFSQFPGHYGTSGTAGPYNAYMTTPTNMQAGPTPEMFQSLSSQFRMGSVQSPYNQTNQMGNPNTMLISSNNSSLMSSSVKSSTQQIGAIGQPKPNGGGSVSQPPYGQQYLNMFPPAPPLQNSAANYYSNSGGSQTAFFGTAGATGGATQNAYGIPAAAVAASNMFGSHGGQNPSNTPQPPPPQQQMPSYSSQFLNSPLLAATNPAMNQQQYRGAPNNSSQHSGANAAAYIKSNQSPQSSHIQQQQQQQQQQDTWELQNQLMQHQPQISNLQQQSAQQLPLLSTGPVGGLQNSQANQHLTNHSRNVLPLNQGNNQLVGCGSSTTGNGSPVVVSGGGGGNGNTGTSSMRGHPQAQASGISGTRYPSPIQRPSSFTHAQSVGIQHHQQRCNRPIGYGQQNLGNNAGHQTAGSGSNVAQGVNNTNKHFYGGNR